MPTRPLIFVLLAALAATPAAWLVRADEADDAKATKDAKAEVKPTEPPKQPPPRPDGPPKDEKRKDDDKRRERGEWGGQRGEWGPGGPGGPGNQGRPRNGFEQFSADELKQMIEAVEPKDKKLAEKMKERLADAIARKPATLTQEQIDAALDVFNDREPSLGNWIKESLKKDSARATSILAMQWPRIQTMVDLKKNDRQLYDAQTVEIQRLNESFSVSRKLREAIQQKNVATIDVLKSQLRDKIAEQHKARQEIRNLELQRLKDKVAALSKDITAEEQNSADQIEKHFQKIMKWIESPSRGPGPGRGNRDGGERDKSEKGDKPDKPEKPEKKEKPE